MVKHALFYFSKNMGLITNNIAKLFSMEMGFSFYLHLSYTKLIIEGDSQLVIRKVKHLLHGGNSKNISISLWLENYLMKMKSSHKF